MLDHGGGTDAGRRRETVSTEKGEVVHEASGRRLKYGALVDKAAALPVPKSVALKAPKDFKVLGQSLPRLDIPEKVNGKAEFGLDVKRPGMLIARVVRCPVFGGKVASFNADKAKAVVGRTPRRRDQQRHQPWSPTTTGRHRKARRRSR